MQDGIDDLYGGLVGSWRLTMQAEGKSPRTLETQGWGPLQFAAWCADRGIPQEVEAITPELVRGWLAALAETKADETIRGRYVGLRQFITWCLQEGELEVDPMRNVRQPRVREQVKPMLTTDQLRALLADCAKGSTFADLRDHALVLMFADTGARLSSITDLHVSRVDLRERTALVEVKGGRQLVLAYGARTARALDKYLRARRRQTYADQPWLWLGSTGKGRLTPNGVYQALRRRAARLGIERLHPHMFRHGFAHAWLSAGGNETDLMELVGWRSRQMVSRYAASSRAERARAAHQRLGPVDNLT